MDPQAISTGSQALMTMFVVGAGVIGSEYASIFAMLGVRVTLIDMRDCLLPVAFCRL